MAPASSYRLQISPEFTLHDASRTLPYLHALGVDWLYLAPLLESAGSPHGYDVVDPERVDDARGGPEALQALADHAHELGMGVLVDIVPNHVGVADPEANAWWRDVLARGRESEYADFFDVDWDAGGGRLRVPMLGDPPESINYRRFFAVSELAAIRVEDPRVFEASHHEIIRWRADGLVDGFRVDHPDGLRDPGAYLERLSEATAGAPIWIEKIIEGDEKLPPEWPIAGTTGYDALALVDRVFVDPRGEGELTRLMDDASGSHLEWADLAAEQKRAMARGALLPEIARIARELAADSSGGTDSAGGTYAANGTDSADTLAALVELAVALPVYRTYLPFGREYLDEAVVKASAARPDLADAIAQIARILADPAHPAALRFQQTSGMVMAKGVEDTAFYRYPRLTSLNEVGGDPGLFALRPEKFHALQSERQDLLPDSMTTLTTHDTKRSEDTRARIAALAEIPGEWAAAFAELRSLVGTSDGALDELVWQAIVGAWPATPERLVDYALKAARESGRVTTWIEPDEAFEKALTDLARSPFENPAVREVIDRFTARVTPAGRSNGLGMKLLQLMSPGMPDVYQGTERWDHSLVDPDNRRPVDFGEASALLKRIDDGWLPPIDDSGAAKLLVVSRALRLRRNRPRLLRGYAPVMAEGPRADHLIGFDRGGVIALATRLPLGLEREGGWDDETTVDVGASAVDVLTRRRLAGRVPLREVFASYPVALVVTE